MKTYWVAASRFALGLLAVTTLVIQLQSLLFLNRLNRGSGRFEYPLKPLEISLKQSCAYWTRIDKSQIPYYPLLDLDSNYREMKDRDSPFRLVEDQFVQSFYRTELEEISSRKHGFRYGSSSLVFATSDCSDPRMNNRNYRLEFPLHTGKVFFPLLIVATIAALAALLNYGRFSRLVKKGWSGFIRPR